jgi:DNA end-binding protein Ku
MPRAIWKGVLDLGRHEVPVKMYSAVQHRKVRFRLLHAEDLEPVQQQIVRRSDGKEVPKDARRKAYALDDERAVILQPEDLERLEPETSREIHLCRFVPERTVSDQWYDRPYYLGPDDGDKKDYFALAQALAGKKLIGVARWVMRRKRYVGGLREQDGYLYIITFRRSDQIVAVSLGEPQGAEPDAKELALAEQLVETISADFDPSLWQDEYRERLWKLIEAKARGRKVPVQKPPRKRSAGGLADQLRRSLATERKVA